jgi:ABC-type transporter Mla MlaB component
MALDASAIARIDDLALTLLLQLLRLLRQTAIKWGPMLNGFQVSSIHEGARA